MLTRWKSPGTLGFAGNIRRLKSPPSNYTLYHTTRLYSESKSHSSLPWRSFFQCPPRENVVHSAIWPFSVFARNRKWREDLEKSINEIRRDVKHSNQASPSELRKEVNEWFQHLEKCIGNARNDVKGARNDIKDLAESKQRQQNSFIEIKRDLEQSLTELRRGLEKSEFRLRSSVEQSGRYQKNAFASFQNEVIDWRSSQKSSIHELKKYVVEHDQQMESTVSELVRMVTELGQDQETLIEQLQKVTTSMAELKRGFEDGSIQDLKYIVSPLSPQADQSPADYDASAAIPYSPSKHLKFIRRIEKMFGFQFEDPALLWQALQFKQGSHRTTAGFNKSLALEGDGALRLALISEANDKENISKFLDKSFVLESNRHMLRLGRYLELDKVLACFTSPPVRDDRHSDTIMIGTTMEAIFAVIVRQGGIPALREVLHNIEYEGQPYLRSRPNRSIDSLESTGEANQTWHKETSVSTSVETTGEEIKSHHESEATNETPPVSPTNSALQEHREETKGPIRAFLRRWLSGPLSSPQTSFDNFDASQPPSDEKNDQVAESAKLETIPASPQISENTIVHKSGDVETNVIHPYSAKQVSPGKKTSKSANVKEKKPSSDSKNPPTSKVLNKKQKRALRRQKASTVSEESPGLELPVSSESLNAETPGLPEQTDTENPTPGHLEQTEVSTDTETPISGLLEQTELSTDTETPISGLLEQTELSMDTENPAPSGFVAVRYHPIEAPSCEVHLPSSKADLTDSEADLTASEADLTAPEASVPVSEANLPAPEATPAASEAPVPALETTGASLSRPSGNADPQQPPSLHGTVATGDIDPEKGENPLCQEPDISQGRFDLSQWKKRHRNLVGAQTSIQRLYIDHKKRWSEIEHDVNHPDFVETLRNIQHFKAALDKSMYRIRCIVEYVELQKNKKNSQNCSWAEFSIDKTLKYLEDIEITRYPELNEGGAALRDEIKAMSEQLKSVLRDSEDSSDATEAIYQLFKNHSEIFTAKLAEFPSARQRPFYLYLRRLDMNLFYARFWDS